MRTEKIVHAQPLPLCEKVQIQIAYGAVESVWIFHFLRRSIAARDAKSVRKRLAGGNFALKKSAVAESLHWHYFFILDVNCLARDAICHIGSQNVTIFAAVPAEHIPWFPAACGQKRSKFLIHKRNLPMGTDPRQIFLRKNNEPLANGAV
jgi:hypothetical protein